MKAVVYTDEDVHLEPWVKVYNGFDQKIRLGFDVESVTEEEKSYIPRFVIQATSLD